MSGIMISTTITELRTKIDNLKKEIDLLGKLEEFSPELITSANLIRSNEYLLEANAKKSSLLDIYSTYTRNLEELARTLLDIQIDLKEIIHEQSKLLEEKPKKTIKTKKKSKK